jgi:ubiquinone/menaquinone biosynthesis C-methylase UbiE
MENILYNKIGGNYNDTRSADKYILDVISSWLKNGEKILDLGCGTGNYTIAMKQSGFETFGVDPSEKMLKVAQQRNKNIEWCLGVAEKIPYPNNFFDGVFGTLTLHHWENIETAFTEIYRVIKFGGNVIFFTSTAEQMKEYWLNHYFPQMLRHSTKQMPSLKKICNAALKAGFEIQQSEKYFIQNDLQDQFLYVGKNNPELYFNNKIRKGISSFSSLANTSEINYGLEKLRSDLISGEFENIKKNYKTRHGDYLFFKAVKSPAHNSKHNKKPLIVYP